MGLFYIVFPVREGGYHVSVYEDDPIRWINGASRPKLTPNDKGEGASITDFLKQYGSIRRRTALSMHGSTTKKGVRVPIIPDLEPAEVESLETYLGEPF